MIKNKMKKIDLEEFKKENYKKNLLENKKYKCKNKFPKNKII